MKNRTRVGFRISGLAQKPLIGAHWAFLECELDMYSIENLSLDNDNFSKIYHQS
jgi:hypothetical protein